MYDAPLDTLARIGWLLAAGVLVLLGLRAVLVERAAAASGRGGPRAPGRPGRVLLLVLALVLTVAVAALLCVLGLEVREGLGS